MPQAVSVTSPYVDDLPVPLRRRSRFSGRRNLPAARARVARPGRGYLLLRRGGTTVAAALLVFGYCVTLSAGHCALATRAPPRCLARTLDSSLRANSSAGSERLPYTQDVGGSNPSSPMLTWLCRSGPPAAGLVHTTLEVTGMRLLTLVALSHSGGGRGRTRAVGPDPVGRRHRAPVPNAAAAHGGQPLSPSPTGDSAARGPDRDRAARCGWTGWRQCLSAWSRPEADERGAGAVRLSARRHPAAPGAADLRHAAPGPGPHHFHAGRNEGGTSVRSRPGWRRQR